MFRQVQVVTLTYLSRRVMWFAALLAIVYAVNLIAVRATSLETVRASTQFFIGFPAGLIAYLAVSQSKWHFVNPRARLLPRFAAAHLTVVGLLVLLGLAVLPWVSAVITGLNALGAMACTIAIAASFTWAMHAMHMGANLVALAAFFSLLSGTGAYFWFWPAAADQFRLFHWGILIAGWTAEIAWIVRLAFMTEEDGDYSIPINVQSGSATRMEREQANRNMARHLVQSHLSRLPSDVWHDRLHCLRATTSSARQRLLHYGFVPTPIVFQAVFMAVGFFAVMLFIADMVESSDAGEGVNISALNMMVVMPALIPAQLLPMRRARMAQELLLPLSRRQYIDGILAALAWQTFVIWMVMCLGLIAYLAVRTPQQLSVEFLMALAGLTVALQVCNFGYMTWAANHLSAVARMAWSILVFFPSLIAATLSMNALNLTIDEFNPVVPWATSGVLVALGVVGLTLSRRRWLQTELG